MMKQQATFEDLRNLLMGIEPDNLPHDMVIQVAARIVVNAATNPQVLKDAQQIVGEPQTQNQA